MRLQGRLSSAILISCMLIGVAGCQQADQASEKVVVAPKPDLRADETPGLKKAVFAGGCFWGVEGVFSHVKGVRSAVSGFHGGGRTDADYAMVSGGMTDHAEAVQVTYDPAMVSYDQLLRIFFSVVADPTLVNRQGPDVGSQYRSALVALGAEQKKVAKAYLAQMERSDIWRGPIVTALEPYRAFYAAEPDHQDFMAQNPNHPYIRKWDAPKVKALARLYPDAYKKAFTRG